MNDQKAQWNELAARAGNGDDDAQAELRRQLEPHVRRMIRRALRPDVRPGPLTNRLRREAETILSASWGRLGEDRPAQVTRHLCDRVLAGMCGQADD